MVLRKEQSNPISNITWSYYNILDWLLRVCLRQLQVSTAHVYSKLIQEERKHPIVSKPSVVAMVRIQLPNFIHGGPNLFLFLYFSPKS